MTASGGNSNSCAVRWSASLDNGGRGKSGGGGDRDGREAYSITQAEAPFRGVKKQNKSKHQALSTARARRVEDRLHKNADN